MNTTAPAALPPIELGPRDITPYRQGNVGIPYVHRFDSGKPGPHVLINALTHGNEFCGMWAATYLLDNGVRPLVGTMTVSFANVQAYESFDPLRPFESRQLVHNLNRIWSDAQLGGSEDSPELRRARELLPVVMAADHVLDIHSTSQPVQPFWVYPDREHNAQAARAIGRPRVHMVMPQGLGSGTPLIQHGKFAQPGSTGVALVAECGQHFSRSAAALAVEVALDFLGHFGLVDRPARERAAQQRLRLLKTFMVKTPEFRFTRPLKGFETFDQGELIATDGGEEIRALCPDCTVMMPTREPIVGREAVYLTQPVA